MDLAKWALRTSPKFTTMIKYQFHYGFVRQDQRSENPNHPLPPNNNNELRIKSAALSSKEPRPTEAAAVI